MNGQIARNAAQRDDEVETRRTNSARYRPNLEEFDDWVDFFDAGMAGTREQSIIWSSPD